MKVPFRSINHRWPEDTKGLVFDPETLPPAEHTGVSLSALLDLAERCEAATGPSVILDRAICRHALDDEPILPTPFTASLDAALTLVPDGFDWIIGRTNGGLTIYAEVGGTGAEFQRFASSPALALAAAALQARAKTRSSIIQPHTV